MNLQRPFLKYLIVLFAAVAFWNIEPSKAQEISPVLKDTTKTGIQTIKISEISIRSNQVVSQTNQIFEALISDQDIEKVGKKNDSLISSIDDALRVDMAGDLDDNNIRQLNNKLAYWKQINEKLKQEEASLSAKIQRIDQESVKLMQERTLWHNTLESLSNEEAYNSIITRIDEILHFIDDMGNKMAKKSESLLVMLNRTADLDYTLNEFLARIENTQIKHESQIFVRHHESLFKINWGNWSNWNPLPPVRKYYKEEIRHLLTYLELNISRFITMIAIFGVLLIIFRSVKKHIIQKGIRDKSFFGKRIEKVFRNSGMLAFILGIFSFVFLFPNRPEILSDIGRIILIFPLANIIFILLNKRFARYLILFGILIVLVSAIYIFPPDHLLSRILILAIAVTEMAILWSLIRFFNKNPLINHFNNFLLKFILIFNLIVTFSGIVGALSGATMLAEEAVSVPVISAFAAMLLIVTVISLGGLLEIAIDSPRSRKSNVIRIQGKKIKARIFKLLTTGAAIYWLYVFLRSINLNRRVLEGIKNIITHEISIGSANFTIGEIFVFILVIWISVILSRFLQIVLEKDVLNRFKLAKGIPYTVGLMVRYAIITAGIFLAVSAAGLSVTNLGILIGALGVGIGFGLQNIFNNLVSGLILLFERPIQIGDTVEVGSLIGKVKSIGIRSSNVRTFEGAEVIVPNGQFISNEVVNWTLSDQNRRIEVIAGVAYGSDPHKVQKLLFEAIKKHPDVIDEPPPEVFFNGLGESSLDFRILFWTANINEWLRIRSEIVFMVHDVLKENGIEIPFPQRDLHIKSIIPGSTIIQNSATLGHRQDQK